MRAFILSLAALLILGIFAADSEAQEAAGEERPSTQAGRSTVYAPNGVIATSQPLASAAGLAVLERGGNAVDAAITAAAVLTVTEPHMTGMGGDAFAILWDSSEERLVGLDASGRSGSLMTAEEIRNRGHEGVPGTGAESVTVPGSLNGWAALLEEYGTLTLSEALEPAIRLAEEGFPVTPIIAEQWAGQEEKLRRDAGAREAYLVDGERAPEAGEWVRNPDLAESYRLVAREGPSALYGGELGRRLVDGLRELGGFLTLDDLRRDRVRWVDPISADFRGYTLWQLPPSGQGIAALQMLEILEPFPLEDMGHNSPDYLHHLIEAKKLAFADLDRHVADPDHMTVTVEELLDEDYLSRRRGLIDPHRALTPSDPEVAATAGETIYLAAADQDGNMISFIQSIYGYFGSGVVVPGTGMILQNRGAGFTLEEGHPNQVAPGKRPFHTIIPAFVTRDGDPWMAYGVMGGSMQPQGHVQVLLNLLLFGMDPQEANDAARFRHHSGLRAGLEAPIGDRVREALEGLGHEISVQSPGGAGGTQMVIRLDRGWAASSDPRKDGMAAGH